MGIEEKDPELHTFASAQQFPPPPRPVLQSALTKLGIALKKKRHYTRSQEQMDDAKRVSDRIMGESNDA